MVCGLKSCNYLLLEEKSLAITHDKSHFNYYTGHKHVGNNTSNVNPVALLSSHPKLQISAI